MSGKLSSLFVLAAASVAVMVAPARVEAQPTLKPPTLVPPECTVGYPGFSITPSDCSGAWGGNVGEPGSKHFEYVLAQIESDWGTGFSYLGKADDTGLGPFSDVDFSPTGTLDFTSAITGSFILALKGSKQYSLYLFEDVAGLDYLDFSMEGVATNKSGEIQGLSNASLWVSSTTVVPEPSTVILLGSGLFSLGLVGYRRRRAA